VTQTVELW